MPSPFPGMDPYLEEPATWLGLRLSALAAIQDQLAPLLRPRYVIDFAQRSHAVGADDPAYAMVAAGMGPRSRSPFPAIGLNDYWMVVCRPRRGPVVTAIELTTPGGKVDGSILQRAVQDRRAAARDNRVNWVGIDLLRGGTSLQRGNELPPAEYLTVADLGGRAPGTCHGWPLRLTERLPVIGVPVAADEADVPLDLQRLVDHVYRISGHEFRCDYAADPPLPAMSADTLAWCRATVEAARG